MNEADDTEEGEGSWKNDDLAKVKGPENRGCIRCIGKIATVKVRRASSTQNLHHQVPALQAQVSKHTSTVHILLNAIKKHMSPDELVAVVNNLNNEFDDEQSPSNRRSSAGSHQIGGDTNY